MKIIILRIPDSTTKKELELFVSRGMKRVFRMPFSGKPVISSCRVVRIEDKNTKVTEHHGLVAINPDKLGPAIIKRLSGTRLNDKAVFVRQFFDRLDDLAGYLDVEADFDPNDKRRPNLEISSKSDVTVTALDNMSRSHGPGR